MAYTLCSMVAALLCAGGAARAQEVEGDYLNMSFTGDGESPSAMERLATAALKAAPPLAGGASVSPMAMGDASYALPIAVPPARLAPSLALTYSSGGGITEVGRGWSIEVGPKISEPLGRQAVAYDDVPGVHLVSGAGFSGMLVPSEVSGKTRWRWVSTTPGAVVASFNPSTHTWSLRADGITWTLVPTPGVPGEYHAVSQVDGSGNRVDYAWNGARISRVTYGGTSTAGHFLAVQFNYVAARHLAYEGRGGDVRSIAYRLGSVQIESKFGHASFEPRHRYVFDYGVDYEWIEGGVGLWLSLWPSDELLVGVKEAEVLPGGTLGAIRDLAKLEYTGNSSMYEEDPDAPTLLSRTYSAGSSPGTWSESRTGAALVDASGDGLPDVLTPGGVAWQRLWYTGTDDDYGMPVGGNVDRWWEELAPDTGARPFEWVTTPISPALDESITVVVAGDGADFPEEEIRTTYARRRLLDLDGDGYQDVIETGAVPCEYVDPASDARFCASLDPAFDNESPAETIWTVWYGSAAGYVDPPVEELAPFRFPRVSTRPDLPEVHTEYWGDPWFFEDATLDLVDVDGDGWLDILQVPGLGSPRYWPRVRGHGGGWARTPEGTTATPIVMDDLPTMASTSASMGEVMTGDLAVSAYGFDVEVPKVLFMNAQTGFRDLNGDGALDYVDARAHASAPTSGACEFGEWQVWLGDGAGGFDPAIDWAAPVGWIARTDEGSPWVTTHTVTATNLSDVRAQQAALMDLEDSLSMEWLEDWILSSFEYADPFHEVLDPTEVDLVLEKPPVAGPDPNDPSSFTTYGRRQALLGALMDMDGDGRPDLVDGEWMDPNDLGGVPGAWFRNAGDGFECVPHPLSSAIPVDGIYGGNQAALLSSSWTKQKVVTGNDGNPATIDDVDAHAEQATTVQDLLVADIDQDGLPDVVDLRDPDARAIRYLGRSVDEEGIPTGGTRPGLLQRVDTGSGGYTTLAWRSSALAYPSGQAEAASTPIRKDLVAEVVVGDEVSHWEGKRRYFYSDGLVEDGKWLGFGSVIEIDYETQARVEWNPQVDSAFLGRTTTTYELARDWALPTTRLVEEDRNRSYLYGRDLADLSIDPLRETTWSYRPSGGVGLVEPPTSRWIDEITVTEYPSPRDLSVPVVGGRTSTVTIEYDAVGNVVEQRHTADGRPQDQITVKTPDWVSNNDGSLWRPLGNETWSSDLDAPETLELVESGAFEWDADTSPSAGLLTRQTVCGGTSVAICDPASQLEWTFGRTARGAVSEILAPAARDTFNDAFDFGETAVTSQRNALSHVTGQAVDDLGRVTEVTDPNGVVNRTTFDAFGRPVKTEVRGAGLASSLRTVTETTYHDGVIPNWSETVHHQWLPTGVEGEPTRSYVVYDGFGRELQTWSRGTSGTWVVVDRETDVRGNVRWTSEPHVETAFDTDYDVTTGYEASSSYVDLFGAPFWTYDDGKGVVSYDRPAAGTVRSLDWEGYEREEKYDTHGRLVEVREGKPSVGPLRTTGSYDYDGLGRVVRFTDGNKNAWKYDFDGAGRLRQVWRQPTGAVVWTPYYAYEWDGPDPSRMIEGDPNAASPVVAVEWAYDLLGRTVQKRVADPLVASGWQTWTWSWDGVWIGARDAVTDPDGEVVYDYQPDPIYGGFGWPTGTAREWNDGTLAEVTTTYDAEGRALTTTWPSGTVVTSDYWPNGSLRRSTVGLPNPGTITVDYTYDSTWGLPAGWTMTRGAQTYEHTIARLDASRVQELRWRADPGNGDHRIGYEWQGNGWLRTKSIDALEPISYGYDGLGRIDGIYQGYAVPGAVSYEKYTYDPIGNPVSFERNGAPAVTWEYASAPRFNEIPSRIRPGTGIVETMTYHPVTGRMLTWDNTGGDNIQRDFAYDGAGHLRQIDRSGAAGPIRRTRLRYDVDDQIVTEVATSGPATTIYRFGGWRKELPSNQVIESVLPMLRLVNGLPRVAYLEESGNAMWTVDASGANVSFEALGAYGLALNGLSTGTPWTLDQLHGAEPDRDDEVVHYGARHMLLRDGMWMQPEPLLHLGITNGNLANPLGYGGLYAAGNTNVLHDRSGAFPDREAAATLTLAGAATGVGATELLAATVTSGGTALAVAPLLLTIADPVAAGGADMMDEKAAGGAAIAGSIRDYMGWSNANSSSKEAEPNPNLTLPAPTAEPGSSNAFSPEKQALVDMAQRDKKTGGVTRGDMEAYKELNKGLPDPFPEDKVRGPEVHPLRTPQSTPGPAQQPHGHVGPVNHIPMKDEPLE